MPARALGHQVVAVLAATLGSIGVLAAQQGNSLAHDFEKAITLMESRGEVVAAARLFEKVAAGKDRSLAARALVYLETCYEQSADDRARDTYRRVLDHFADQSAPVAQARARLAELERRARAVPASGIVLRQFWTQRPPGVTGFGRPSADGRVVLLHGPEGHVILQDLQSQRLDNPIDIASARGSLGPCWPWSTVLPSPDGVELLFSCEPDQGGPYEVRVVRADARRPEQRRLMTAAPGEIVEPLEWRTRDSVLVETVSSDGTRQLAILDLHGNLKGVTRLDGPVMGASMSPDGAWLVYGGLASGDALHHDIFIVPRAGGAQTLLVGGESDDLYPIWTPDGSGVVIVSNRTGAPGLWLQRVQQGRTTGSPIVLTQDLGRIAAPPALTAQGAYLYFRETGLVDVYTAGLDPDTLVASPPSTAGAERMGGNLYPAWSPDRRQLAYVSRTLGLIVRDVLTGKERRVATATRDLTQLRWASKGNQLLARGRDLQGRYGYFSVSAADGRVTALKVVPVTDESFLGSADWDPDARSIVFLAADPTGPTKFTRLHLADSREDTLYTFPKGVSAHPLFAVSVRSGAIAFVELAEKQPASLKVLDRAGHIRTAVTGAPDETLLQVAWLPDDRGLVFLRRKTDQSLRPDQRWPVVWAVDLTTGALRSLGISMDGVRSLSLSPDGLQLAFSAGWPTREPWMVENFLPELRTSPAPGRR